MAQSETHNAQLDFAERTKRALEKLTLNPGKPGATPRVRVEDDIQRGAEQDAVAKRRKADEFIRREQAGHGPDEWI